MEEKTPILNKIKGGGGLRRPLWVSVLLLFTVIALFSVHINKEYSIFSIPLDFISGRVGLASGSQERSCSDFFNQVPARKVVKSIRDFGGIGDGKTSNTKAFQRAMEFMARFTDSGGSQLVVPKGRWLTGSFNLTSNFTLFLQRGAVILGSQAIDRFREHEHGILIATDVAARGLDIPGVRTVIHYQLPHSAEVYVHRSGRTARAHSDGCSIALITPNDTSKFAALCKSFSKDDFQRFPLEMSYMPEVMKRLSLARQIDKISRKDSQDKAKKNWLERSAELMELVLEDNDSEEERVNNHKRKKATSAQLTKLQEELKSLLSRPLQPKTFSRRYLAGAGVSPLLQNQLEELARQKNPNNSGDVKRKKLIVIGQDCVEPLQALKSAGPESKLNLKDMAEKRRDLTELRRKRKDTKKRLREQRRKQKKKLQAGKE